MKKLLISSIIALLVLAGNTAKATNRPPEYLGLPGDNLNLYAVMKLFQESETLEGFERKLNDENSRINNLDLNGDNLIDYISVIDYPDGNVHSIVMQVALNSFEKQDVAVFTVQRFTNGSARIQLIGDEALYGKNYIIEPIYADNSGETPNPGYSGTSGYNDNIQLVGYTTYEIAAWPLVRFIYLPGYVAWHSSFYWGWYPTYWHSWHPYYWDYYYGYHYNWYPDYYGHFHHCQYNSYANYNNFYYNNRRSYSPEVSHRIRGGDYRATYSHPEQRREGEALYTRMNSGHNDITSRRSGTTTADRKANNTFSGQKDNNPRRSATTVTEPRHTNTFSGQNPGNIRRSTTGVTEKTRTNNTLSGKKADVSHRLSASSSDKPVTNTYSSQTGRTPRSSAPTFSDRTVSRSDQTYKKETARSSRPSAPSFSSTNQRSSRENKAGTSTDRKTTSSDSEKNKTSHRR
jgi:hypothetical protein